MDANGNAALAPEIEIRPAAAFESVAELWQALEARADPSFFQSWYWMGCLAEERFRDPWLISARQGGRTVALALFNRAPRHRPWQVRPMLLGESGDPGRDSIFVEHNAILAERDVPPTLIRHCFAAAADTPPFRGRTWRLSGIPADLAELLPTARRIRLLRHRPAPFLDLSRFDGTETVLDGLSANTRQQLRRSLRKWQPFGPLRVEPAASLSEALRFLDALRGLHQAYWQGRGQPGAFAEPFFERFHRTMIERAWADRAVDLLRVAAGDRILGYLYNFAYRGTVYAYQSGIDFQSDSGELRPGLVSHLLAIEHYRNAGMRLYDFLGGEARYKRSLSNAETELLWIEARPRFGARLIG